MADRMKKIVKIVLPGLMLLWALVPKALASEYQLVNLAQNKSMPLSGAVDELGEKRLVLVGEVHDMMEHHLAQLAVIRALFEAGKRVAVGLEMFDHQNQSVLDDWVEGNIAPADFQKAYYRDWNFPWKLYSPIFEFAREHRIPMVGLNVSRKITQKVAKKGFDSLTESQRGKLAEDIVCVVDPDYMKFIREVFGAHAHGNLNFTYFCEAQLVWDTVMAVHALDYLKNHPDTMMVLITGNGHARKMGIPAQVEKRSQIPYTVILPETPGYITQETVSEDDADYIIRHGP